MPNILLFDIEVTPNLTMNWEPRIYSGYLPPENIVQERVISCIAWKWLKGPRIFSSHFAINKFDDRGCIERFLHAWQKADAVITQNGDEFDVKWVRGRAAIHKLPVMKEVLQIDTKKMSKKAFNLNGHGLDYKGKIFGVGGKLNHPFSLWKKIMLKDKKALREQVRYCKQDVRLLEGVFLNNYKWEPRIRSKVRDLYLAAGLL